MLYFGRHMCYWESTCMNTCATNVENLSTMLISKRKGVKRVISQKYIKIKSLDAWRNHARKTKENIEKKKMSFSQTMRFTQSILDAGFHSRWCLGYKYT